MVYLSIRADIKFTRKPMAMASTFFDLPLEIRLDIYSLVFGSGKVIIEPKANDESCCIVPQHGILQNHPPRSSQLLRVNRTILLEARPVLYANTVFHVVNQAFAGRLPTRVTDGHPCAAHLKHVIWQLDCDLLKHFYPEDLCLDLGVISQWHSFEIRCRADAWRNSFIGEWCDREAFINGRAQVIEYAGEIHQAMSSRKGVDMTLIEDRSQLGRGRVILRLEGERSYRKQQQSFRDGSMVVTIRLH